MSTGPKISLGSVKRVSRYSKYCAWRSSASERIRALLAVPGGPSRTQCSPATTAIMSRRMISSLPRNWRSREPATTLRRSWRGDDAIVMREHAYHTQAHADTLARECRRTPRPPPPPPRDPWRWASAVTPSSSRSWSCTPRGCWPGPSSGTAISAREPTSALTTRSSGASPTAARRTTRSSASTSGRTTSRSASSGSGSPTASSPRRCGSSPRRPSPSPRRRFRSRPSPGASPAISLIASLAALAMLLTPQLLLADLADFHAATLCVLPIAVLAWGIEVDSPRAVFLAALAAISLREQMGLLLFAAGVAWVIRHGKRRLFAAGGLALLGLAFFFIAVKWAIPAFGSGQSFRYMAQYNRLGGTADGVLATAQREPLTFLAMALQGDRKRFVLELASAALRCSSSPAIAPPRRLAALARRPAPRRAALQRRAREMEHPLALRRAARPPPRRGRRDGAGARADAGRSPHPRRRRVALARDDARRLRAPLPSAPARPSTAPSAARRASPRSAAPSPRCRRRPRSPPRKTSSPTSRRAPTSTSSPTARPATSSSSSIATEPPSRAGDTQGGGRGDGAIEKLLDLHGARR